MDIEIIEKLDEITDLINDSKLLKEFSSIKEKVLKDSFLVEKINSLKEIENIYGDEYRNLKEEIFLNKDFRRYKELENEVYLFLLKINSSLNNLKKEDLWK